MKTKAHHILTLLSISLLGLSTSGCYTQLQLAEYEVDQKPDRVVVDQSDENVAVTKYYYDE
ncbi:MAG TPA: hypothetical protein VGA18_02835, partial [Rhodothermales bacterium]